MGPAKAASPEGRAAICKRSRAGDGSSVGCGDIGSKSPFTDNLTISRFFTCDAEVTDGDGPASRAKTASGNVALCGDLSSMSAAKASAGDDANGAKAVSASCEPAAGTTASGGTNDAAVGDDAESVGADDVGRATGGSVCAAGAGHWFDTAGTATAGGVEDDTDGVGGTNGGADAVTEDGADATSAAGATSESGGSDDADGVRRAGGVCAAQVADCTDIEGDGGSKEGALGGTSAALESVAASADCSAGNVFPVGISSVTTEEPGAGTGASNSTEGTDD
mmetsp:Transcript_61088/g.154679  ORF Transcript_61088/g.154679 Transcript_61088/m.154679 type:complete len:279 (-) Transcript_61088:205-1041(-)